MSSTARLDYTVVAIRNQINQTYDAKVAHAHEQYAATLDAPAKVAAWREEQERRVIDVAAALEAGEVDDDDLARFRVRSMPDNPRKWNATGPEDKRDELLKRAEGARDRAPTRLDGIRTVDGAVSLTAKMLSDWFGV